MSRLDARRACVGMVAAALTTACFDLPTSDRSTEMPPSARVIVDSVVQVGDTIRAFGYLTHTTAYSCPPGYTTDFFGNPCSPSTSTDWSNLHGVTWSSESPEIATLEASTAGSSDESHPTSQTLVRGISPGLARIVARSAFNPAGRFVRVIPAISR